ncbi:MAG: hypothetical protein ACRYFS_17615 [Janthinobacterium lividum]
MKFRSVASAAIPFALLSLALLAPAAHAQLNVKFNTPTALYTSSLPQTFAVTATLINNFNSVLYLNGDSPSMNAPLDINDLDDTPFQNTFAYSDPQLTLAAHGGRITTTIFDFTIPGGTDAGTYGGSFDFLGGTTPDDQTYLATGTYSFRVQDAPVPEASTTVSFGLLLLLGGTALIVRRRKTVKA